MTQFQVSLFQAITDPAPFATIPMTAKMPLGALVFALKQRRETYVARVDVTSGEERTTFYHVALGSESITYDREGGIEEQDVG